MYAKVLAFMGNKERNQAIGLLLIRVAIATIFLLNGIQKFIYKDQAITFFGQIGLPAYMLWVVAIVEVLGGMMILFGFMTCVASILLAIIMVVAIIKVKIGGGFVMSLVSSQVDIAMLLPLISIFFMGPGKYSLGCSCGICSAGNCSCSNGVCACTK